MEQKNYKTDYKKSLSQSHESDEMKQIKVRWFLWGFSFCFVLFFALNLYQQKFSFFASDVRDPLEHESILTVMEHTIRSEFVENVKTGKLFVIKGKIANNTDSDQTAIKVKCNLYNKDSKLRKTATTYCGNILSPQELKEYTLKEINHRMADTNSIVVNPGDSLDFMFVIDELPQDLIEFEIIVSE